MYCISWWVFVFSCTIWTFNLGCNCFDCCGKSKYILQLSICYFICIYSKFLQFFWQLWPILWIDKIRSIGHQMPGLLCTSSYPFLSLNKLLFQILRLLINIFLIGSYCFSVAEFEEKELKYDNFVQQIENGTKSLPREIPPRDRSLLRTR